MVATVYRLVWRVDSGAARDLSDTGDTLTPLSIIFYHVGEMLFFSIPRREFAAVLAWCRSRQKNKNLI